MRSILIFVLVVAVALGAYKFFAATPDKPITTTQQTGPNYPKPSVPRPQTGKASVEEGAKAARKCAVCHSFDKGGPNKVGPHLWGIVGGDVASSAGFSYSAALKGVGGKWDFEHLNKFLHNPKGTAPGTKMAFAGIKNDAERAAVIAYLRSLSDSPVPLP